MERQRPYQHLCGQVDLVPVDGELRAYFWPWNFGAVRSRYRPTVGVVPAGAVHDPWAWVDEHFIAMITGRDGDPQFCPT